jgi:hypothetical protein
MNEHNEDRWFWIIVIAASTPWAIAAGFYIVAALT